MVLCFQIFSLLDNVSTSPGPSHRDPKQMNQGYVTYLCVLWEEGCKGGLWGVCDPCIVCRFMEEGGRKCLGFIRFAKCYYYTCMCINTHTYTSTYTNRFPTLRTLLSIEEKNKTTSVKAHKMIPFCNNCELNTYILIFKYFIKYQRQAEIVESIIIEKINQETQ